MEIEKISGVSKDELQNHIMSRLCDRYEGYGTDLPEEKLDEIGVRLIQNYANLKLTAEDFDMSEARLRTLVKTNILLQAYFEIAHEGIKSLMDSHLIEGIRKGDKDIIRLVATRMYAGRGRGGHNITEIGTIGYNDPLAKKLASETESDRKQQNVRVEFNFVKKEMRQHASISAVSEEPDAVDAEFEDVEDDDKQ